VKALMKIIGAFLSKRLRKS